MATNAYDTDFWIGRVFRSRDSRETWRHVIIVEIRNGRAKCHTMLYQEPGKMNSRGSWISLKSLATRWQTCPFAECWCKGETSDDPPLPHSPKPLTLTVDDQIETRSYRMKQSMRFPVDEETTEKLKRVIRLDASAEIPWYRKILEIVERIPRGLR